jgi:hypothetical protein
MAWVTTETIAGNSDVAALSDRELWERLAHQLDHLDALLHDEQRANAEFRATLEPLLPLVPRALALLDPMRKWRPAKGARDAVRQDGP